MAQRTDPEKVCQDGYRDGYQQAKSEMQREVDGKVDRLVAKTAELDAEARAVRVTLARLRTLDCTDKLKRMMGYLGVPSCFTLGEGQRRR